MSLLLKTVISIAVVMAIGFTSGMTTAEAIPNWYVNLNKPVFNPPNWLFGPAWTLLYILMGIAFARIWHQYKPETAYRLAIGLFVVQLVLNFFWTLIFFGMKNPALALAEIVVLWGFILATILQFRKLDTVAAWLLVPYLAWVSFATLLNFMIWKLNPEL